MTLRPFFSYYGSKWAAAKRYPAPSGRTLVEPFAGSAGYSLRYPDRAVTLVESDPVVAGVWRYLISASAERVRELPDIAPGQDLRKVGGLEASERNLIGFWLNRGVSSPRWRLSAWASGKNVSAGNFWGVRARERIASQLSAIRHWALIEGDYSAAPEADTTFIDPPYQGRKGEHYIHGSSGLDYASLGAWARQRRGLVVVCEAAGARWLPFRSFGDLRATRGGVSSEVVWLSQNGRGHAASAV